MARDIAYKWVRPLKAWEYYVDRGVGGADYIEDLGWLRARVVEGNLRVKFDGLEITPLIARLLLELRDLKFPSDAERHPLPADFLLNRPDIERLLKLRNTSPTKRPGRPKGAGSLALKDRELVHRMNQMISSGGFASPSAAARHLVQSGEVPGKMVAVDSKVRRLVERYKERHGDDG